MKRLVFLAALLITTPAFAFEGSFDFKMTPPASQKNTATSAVKGKVFISKQGATRLDMKTPASKNQPPQDLSVIKPAKGKKVYTVMHDSKMVMAREVPRAKRGPSENHDNVRVEKLGNERVGKEPTRHIRITDKKTGDVTELWLSDRYPPDLFARALSGGALGRDGDKSWSDDMSRGLKRHGIKPGMPIKMTFREKGTSDVASVAVNNIRKHRVNKSKFVPPKKGYKQHDTPNYDDFKAFEGIGKNPPRNEQEAEAMKERLMKQAEALRKKYGK